jgi:RecG-like helicase
MRTALLLVLGLALALVTGVRAADEKGKEVTLKGTITCAKCDLKKENSCMTVIVVKKNGEDVVYYLDRKAHKANHKQICQTPKEGTVKGTVSEKDGKKIITAKKVTFND